MDCGKKKELSALGSHIAMFAKARNLAHKLSYYLKHLAMALGQELPDLLAPMNGRAVPNDQKSAAQLPPGVLEKGHAFLATQGVAARQGSKAPRTG